MGIPGVRRQKQDIAGGRSEPVNREPINKRVRLIDADFLDRQHVIEQRGQSGMVERGAQHIRRPVRQYRGGQPGLPQPRQNIRHVGKDFEIEIKAHQPVAQPGGGQLQRRRARNRARRR